MSVFSTSISKFTYSKFFPILIAVLATLGGFLVGFLLIRIKYQNVSPQSQLVEGTKRDFPASYSSQLGWYDFQCIVKDFNYKPLVITSNLSSILNVDCEYLDARGVPSIIVIPIALKKNSDEYMIYSFTPKKSENDMTQYYVEEILKQKKVIKGTKLLIGFGLPNDVNKGVPSQQFVAGSISEIYTEDKIESFRSSGNIDDLKSNGVLIPISIILNQI